MIKVGQIYGHKHARRNIIICVTRIRANGFVYVIGNNGIANTRFLSDFENYTFLAEYPTWQEAVNSNEFSEVGNESK